MFRNTFTITLLIIVIIEIQKLECSSVEQPISYLGQNCEQVDHLGKCVKRPSFMLNEITKKTVSPKRIKKVL